MKYEYECPNCGNVLMIIRSIHDIEVDYDCPACGTTVNRKYEAPAITFNGKGFYSTDSKG